MATFDNTDQTSALGVVFADYYEIKKSERRNQNNFLTYGSYPKGILLFDMKTSGNHIVKNIMLKNEWENASGNALDGSGLFGADAQRKMIVEALNGAINSCEELKSLEYDFFYACCPGYPEVDVALKRFK